MPRPKPSVHTLMLAAAGICSLWAGHIVQYQLLVPDEELRIRFLEKTGHGYLPWALPVAIMAGLFAAAAAAALGYARERRSGNPLPSPLSSGLKVAGAQVGGFLALETAERMVAGAHLDSLGWRALILSTGVQVLGAAVATLVLLVIGTLGAALTPLPGSKLPRRAAEWMPQAPTALHCRSTLWTRPFAPRGPPQVLTV
ncbi:MAG TPA: hypothetical protein VHJ40_05340 [Actinomycetota bacterium]|nr:hypothetical protein [Actinomycetota bacterium]